MTEQECKSYQAMAKLALDPQEERTVLSQANRLEQGFALLDTVDTEGVLPLVTVSALENRLREDEARSLLPRERILRDAPEQYDGYFQAPKTLE